MLSPFELNFAAATIDLLAFWFGALTDARLEATATVVAAASLAIAERSLGIAANVGANVTIVAALAQNYVVAIDTALTTHAALIPPVKMIRGMNCVRQ